MAETAVVRQTPMRQECLIIHLQKKKKFWLKQYLTTTNSAYGTSLLL